MSRRPHPRPFRVLAPPRRERLSRRAAPLAVLVALLVPGPLASAAVAKLQSVDVVKTNGGAELRGEVLAETQAGLVLGLRHGASTTLPWDRVSSIEYQAPAAFHDADVMAEAGSFADALDALDALGDVRKLRRPLRQEVLFRRATLNERLGRFDDAARAFESLFDEFPQGRYLDEVVRGLVECQLDRGQPHEAAVALDRIERTAESTANDPRFASRVGLLRGLVLEAGNRLTEARARFEAAEGDRSLDPADRAQASLHVARVLQAQGDLAGAEARYRSLVAREAPALVLAGAWNGLADMSVDRGVKLRDTDTLGDALLAYLRSVVLYVPDVGESTAEYRRGVAGAARCFDYLSQLATDPATKALNRRRAADMQRRLEEQDG